MDILDFIGPLSCCVGTLVNASFHFAIYLDDTVYRRMRIRNEWNIFTFYAGHVLLHILPLIVSIGFWVHTVRVHHVATSSGLHLLWVASVSSRGRFGDLSHVYVRMDPRHWHLCIFVGIVAQVPLLFV